MTVPATPPRLRALPLREAELARLWAAQTIPPEALQTTDGRRVVVRYRGRPGRGPGPDFRDAVLWLDPPAGAPAEDAALCGWLRGDIELHVRASDFARHGHAVDRAYLRLALHVVFLNDAPPPVLLDGRTVPVVALERWVQHRAGAIRLALADPAPYREPCHDAVQRLGVEAARGLLEEAGTARLREKAARLALLIAGLGSDEALYVALARALGLTANAEPMEHLARALPLAELRAVAAASPAPVPAAERALLGAAGLLDEQPSPLSKAAPRVTGLCWQERGLRPAADPRGRVRALAALALRPGLPLDATLEDWRAALAGAPAALLAPLTVSGLAGRDRAVELAVNAVLPWLLASWPEDGALAAAVFTAYRLLPAPAYGATRLLIQNLRDERGRPLVGNAAALQGTLAFARVWCTRGGCGRCPLS